MQVEMVGNAHNIHAFVAQVCLSYQDSDCFSSRAYKWATVYFSPTWEFQLYESQQVGKKLIGQY